MDDYKRTKSEVEIRNGNGKIDIGECKTSTAGAACVAVCSYSHIYVYTAIQECTYMTIWKYRNTAIKICRYVEKG